MKIKEGEIQIQPMLRLNVMQDAIDAQAFIKFKYNQC